MAFVAPNLACGEARGGRIPGHGAVTDEQRSHRPNSAQPGGRQVFFAQTSLLAPHRSTAAYARRSRLVWAKNPLPRTSSYLCLRPLSSYTELHSGVWPFRSEEHTSELQSRFDLVCRLLLEKKNYNT